MQAWHIEGFFPLPAGKVVIRLEQPTFFPHIDKLLIAPNPDGIVGRSTVTLQPDFIPEPIFVQQLQEHFVRKLIDPDTKAVEYDPRQIFGDWRAAVGEFCAAKNEAASSKLDVLKTMAADFQRQADEIIAAGKETDSEDPLFKTLFDAQFSPFAIPKEQEVGYPPEVTAELKRLRTDKSELEAALPKLPEAMAVSDQTPEEVRIHFRGSHLTLGDVVPRRFPKRSAARNMRSARKAAVGWNWPTG